MWMGLIYFFLIPLLLLLLCVRPQSQIANFLPPSSIHPSIRLHPSIQQQLACLSLSEKEEEEEKNWKNNDDPA